MRPTHCLPCWKARLHCIAASSALCACTATSLLPCLLLAWMNSFASACVSACRVLSGPPSPGSHCTHLPFLFCPDEHICVRSSCSVCISKRAHAGPGTNQEALLRCRCNAGSVGLVWGCSCGGNASGVQGPAAAHGTVAVPLIRQAVFTHVHGSTDQHR